MFYTYLTLNEGKYGFGVCTELLYKKLPIGLCYFEVFANKGEAKHREEYFKGLSNARLSALTKSNKVKGFVCHKEGKQTVISFKNGIYNLTSPILVKGQDITIRGQENTVIQGCVKIDSWAPSTVDKP